MSTINQYQATSKYDTDVEYALSVRTINDMSDGINNYVRYVSRFKIASQLCPIPTWQSHGDTENECVIAQMRIQNVPRVRNRVKGFIGGRVYVEGVKSGYTIFNVYCGKRLYTGDADDFAVSKIGDYESDGFHTTTTINSHAPIDIHIAPLRNIKGKFFLIFTAQNTTDDVRSVITSIDLWLE